MSVAKALVHDMPHTLAALDCGALSKWRATLIVRETAALSVEDRAVLGAELCADIATLDGLGDNRISAVAKQIAHRLDAQVVRDRAVTAQADRRVTIRPAPDAMTYVTALSPASGRYPQPRPGRGGVCGAQPGRRPHPRSPPARAVMADTLVQRVTGRPAGTPEPVAVNLVLSDQTLPGGDNTPAVVDGDGPIPASVARSLIDAAVTDERSRATLRRRYRHPKSAALVAMEAQSRCFSRARWRSSSGYGI